MPALDIYHNEAKHALLNDGWTITDDPFTIRYGDVDMYADLGAERLIAATKDTEKIVVEVKSFVGDSLVSEFHKAVGQYLDYLPGLEENDPDRTLYLGIPLEAYDAFFTKRLAQTIIRRYAIKLMVFDVAREVIVQWIR